jgi:hypothetical protein
MVACPILVQSSQAARAMWPSQVARLGLSDFDSSNVACPISVSLQPRWPVQTPNPLAGPAILPVQSWPAILACPFLVCLARPDGCLSNFAFIQFCLQMLPVQFRCVQFRYLWLAQQSCLSNFGCPILACPGGLSRWPVPLACPVGLSKLLCDQTPSYAGCGRSSFGLAPVQSGWSNLDATWPGACPNWIHKLESWPNWKSNWVFSVFCGGWGGTPWKKSRFWLIFSLP